MHSRNKTGAQHNPYATRMSLVSEPYVVSLHESDSLQNVRRFQVFEAHQSSAKRLLEQAVDTAAAPSLCVQPSPDLLRHLFDAITVLSFNKVRCLSRGRLQG